MTEERPEIVEEAERALITRGTLDVRQIPRLLGGALTDLRTIAEGMATLPKLLVSLQGISAKVDSLDDEVKKMRAAVESMGGNVSGLERHLEDVSRAAHPLRRLGSRTRRNDDR
jgi:hypothetical protein